MVYAYDPARARGGRAAARLPARQRALQVRVGRHRTSRSSGSSSGARTADMSAPLPWDPCLTPLDAPSARRRASRSASSRSSRPARTAAPRSTSSRWSPGSTRRATTSRSCRCRRAVPSASSSGPASPVLVIEDPDDAIAVGALAAHLAEVRADVVHAHMYRAETVAARAVIALGEAGPAPAVPGRHRPFEPGPVRGGPRRRCSS